MDNKNKLKNFIGIMPMAGRGERFKRFGYKLPKPLIEIKNKPMFLKSALTFPRSLNWIFIFKNNLKKNKIFLKNINLFKRKKLIALHKHTLGQASTVLKALKFINNKQSIIIHSCDLKFNINRKILLKKINDNDVIVITSKSKKFNLTHSRQFSWVRKNKKKNDIDISIKKNFSKNKNSSRILVGSFIFKNKNILNNCLKYIYKKKLKTNGEYYIDQAALESKNLGYKLDEMTVNKYVSWGSHKELLKFK